jgi:PncC family amidohydrolase
MAKLEKLPEVGGLREVSVIVCARISSRQVVDSYNEGAPTVKKGAETMDRSLEERLGYLLKARGWTLAVAESCTGGLVADRITNIPGASEYFLGGIVAYANAAKEHFLGVGASTLETHGAVSRETALEMARGVRRAFGADLAIAVTGIAGPGGAQAGKPVGLTFVGLSGPAGERVDRHVWPEDRQGNKALSAEAALKMLLEELDRTDG